MIGDILVHIIFAAAVLFMARWIYRNMISKKKDATCSSCDSCAPESREGHSKPAA